eukprot:TRINITY_DN11773_c0_g1_i1.p1 TRINITY_DN11773_c0_g1~~TRINITY_DN11773_c0_g1_i1.p1  ORF type:complete len:715 (+),score=214.13 TRINITY_DN11773_c0_g1_i1:85-2229(+)
MGNVTVAGGIATAVAKHSEDELREAVVGLSEDARKRLQQALEASSSSSAACDPPAEAAAPPATAESPDAEDTLRKQLPAEPAEEAAEPAAPPAGAPAESQDAEDAPCKAAPPEASEKAVEESPTDGVTAAVAAGPSADATADVAPKPAGAVAETETDAPKAAADETEAAGQPDDQPADAPSPAADAALDEGAQAAAEGEAVDLSADVAADAPVDAPAEAPADVPAEAPAAEEVKVPEVLNIVLHEDLSMRGGAQLWLADCGRRLSEAGHMITFILPEDSEIIADIETLPRVSLVKYSHAKSAEDPEICQEMFTAALKPAQVCITLVRQIRGKYQNVRFIAKCIKDAGLKTFLISKTGSVDLSYKREFYGGGLLDLSPPQCCTVTIAEYTRKTLINTFRLDPATIQTIYNGTDTSRFKRSKQMTEEARRRYPMPPGSFVVGSIGRYVPVKGHKVFLRAIKKLLDSGRLPNVHALMVGEGELQQEIEQLVADMGLSSHVSMYPFTKEVFYVEEACDCVAMPSFREGLPNVLLESLALETPCVVSRIYGMPEAVIDDKTGFCFEAGELDDESTWDDMAEGCADAIAKVAELDADERKAMAKNGKRLVFSAHDKAKCFQRILDLIIEKAHAVCTCKEPTEADATEVEQKASLREAFDAIDENRSGAIELHELSRILKALHLHMTEDEVMAVFKCMDTNGNGRIEYEEYMTMAGLALAH